MSAVRLWLVRHGETDWSAAGRFTGWTDLSLNVTGRRQARSLHGYWDGVGFSTVWSSDLRRSIETARLAGAPPPRLDRRLRELDFGSIEGRTWDQLDPATQAAMLAFDGFTADGGESVAELRERVLAFVDDLRAGDHLVFTHGGVIRLLAGDARGRHIGHGELVRVDLRHP